jgi:hypothetical protein
MKEFSQKISDINKTIADNEIEDFIEKYENDTLR